MSKCNTNAIKTYALPTNPSVATLMRTSEGRTDRKAEKQA